MCGLWQTRISRPSKRRAENAEANIVHCCSMKKSRFRALPPYAPLPFKRMKVRGKERKSGAVMGTHFGSSNSSTPDELPANRCAILQNCTAHNSLMAHACQIKADIPAFLAAEPRLRASCHLQNQNSLLKGCIPNPVVDATTLLVNTAKTCTSIRINKEVTSDEIPGGKTPLPSMGYCT